MAAGPGRPRVRKSTASLILAGCLLAGCLTVSIGLFVLRDPVAASRQFYRWRLGGELLSASDVVLQEYRNDCGPAALKMILEHYGVTISLEECRREVGLKSGGTSMLRLLEVAEHHGIRARGMRYDVSRLADIPTPLIAPVCRALGGRVPGLSAALRDSRGASNQGRSGLEWNDRDDPSPCLPGGSFVSIKREVAQ
ncbi:MAG: cysteine peptidase family C39 domain-containing protein [Acidobacteriota bacterium]